METLSCGLEAKFPWGQLGPWKGLDREWQLLRPVSPSTQRAVLRESQAEAGTWSQQPWPGQRPWVATVDTWRNWRSGR